MNIASIHSPAHAGLVNAEASAAAKSPLEALLHAPGPAAGDTASVAHGASADHAAQAGQETSIIIVGGAPQETSIIIVGGKPQQHAASLPALHAAFAEHALRGR